MVVLERKWPGDAPTSPAVDNTFHGGAVMAKRTCSVSGCMKPVLAKALCNMHYCRWRSYGSTDDPRPSRESVFWSRVDVRASDECWLWQGAMYETGYGRFYVGRSDVLAHRYSLELAQGRPIDGDLFVLHSCDTPACVNPHHLRAGTHQDNMNDAKERGRARGPFLAGSSNPSAKLTPGDVRAIRRAYENGEGSQREIGLRFGVSQQAVSRIVCGEGWRRPAKAEGW